MKIDIIDNIDDFKHLESVWNKLYNQISERTVFQSFDFNYYSWNYCLDNYKNNLVLVLVYNNSVLQAICPFYIDRRRRLRFINDSHSDSCDILSIVNLDIDIILEYIYNNFKIHVFYLTNLKVNSCILKYKPLFFDYFLDEFSAIYSVLDLNKGIFPDNFSEYKSKQKTEFRRILKKHKSSRHKILDCETDRFPLDEIYYLRSIMIENGIRSHDFLSPEQLKLIENLYIQGKIIISAVECEKKFTAISFVLNEADRYLIWIDLYDSSKMINLFNYISLLSSLSLNRAIHINFGRGDYDYKISNFLAKKMNLTSFYIFTSKKYKLMFYTEFFVLKYLKKMYNIFKR